MTRTLAVLCALVASGLCSASNCCAQSTEQAKPSQESRPAPTLDELRAQIAAASGRDKSLLQNQLLERIDAPIDERAKTADELIQQYSGSTEHWMLGNALSSKGTVAAQRGDLKSAVEILNQAEEVLARVRDEHPEDYFDCRCNKAAFLLSFGRQQEAVRVLRECIEFAKPYGVRLNVPYAHILLAHIAENSGAVEQAMESLETAFRTAVEAKKTKLAAMAGETTIAILFVSKQYALAQLWVDRAKPYIDDCGDPRVQMSFRMRVEDLRRVNGDPKTAAENLQTLIQSADGTIDRAILGSLYMSLIAAQLQAGHYDDAIATSDLAIDRLEGFARNLLQAKQNRLAAYFAKGEYQRVEKESAEVLAESADGLLLPRIDLLELRSQTLKKLGRFDEAYEVLDECRTLERQALTERATEQAAFMNSLFQQEQQAANITMIRQEKEVAENRQRLSEVNADYLRMKSQRDRWIRNGLIIVALVLSIGTFVVTRILLNRRAARMLAEREREYNRLLTQKLEDQTRAFLAETESRRQLEVKVEQKHRDEALGKLTGGVAHDFNNLLMVILNSCEIARSTGPKLPAETLHLLESSIKAAESGASIVRQLLAYAKLQPLAPRTVTAAEWFSQAGPLFKRTVGHLASFSQRNDATDELLRIDVARLTTAVINLLANARDAIQAGGSVKLLVFGQKNPEQGKPPWPQVPSGRVLVIEIVDTGVGMSPEVLAHACEPFFTTKSEGTGTGLGLSSVVGFVRQSGGEFELRSEAGKGTTARIILPVVDAATDKLQTRNTSDGSAQSPRVLLVEDQESLRFVIGMQLKTLGYDVTEAAASDEAIESIESSGPPAIVITDVRMPGSMSGIQLQKWIHDRFPKVPVVLMSGHLDVQPEPGTVFLQKPVTQQELKTVLSSLPG